MKTRLRRLSEIEEETGYQPSGGKTRRIFLAPGL